MSAYHFSLITPHGKVFDGTTEFLSAPGVEGEFGILGHHAPMVTLLKKGIVAVGQTAHPDYFVVDSGILEVDGKNEVLLLAGTALRAESMTDAKEKVAKL